jgi:antitoxin (DNA-binding transcriptional repressor) of toxin-antitoxin stability system
MQHDDSMACEITQRELRNRSGEIIRALDRGQAFIVTRNSVLVGRTATDEGAPVRRRGRRCRGLRPAAPIEFERFRDDVDAILE